jgi:uncharacterized RDD family membrane protein YckC
MAEQEIAPKPEHIALVTAGFIRRLLAAIVDCLLFAPLAAFLVVPHVGGMLGVPFPKEGNPLTDWWRYLFCALAVFLYGLLMLVYRARTLGMIALQLRVTRTDGAPLEKTRAAWRTLIYAAPFLVNIWAAAAGLWLLYGVLHALLWIGLLWIIVDAKHQAYHDKLAHTLVLFVPRTRRLPLQESAATPPPA